MNNEFMNVIFSDCEKDEWPVICAFSGDPDDGDWSGQVWNGRVPSRYEREPTNTYYTISSFKRNSGGRVNRNKQQFSGMHTVCFDDVGTKIEWSYIKNSGLKPTYVIETSPNNFHVGFKVIVVRDFDTADKVLRAFIRDACGGVDSGMGNVTRYLRMPNGWNMKPKYVNGVAGFEHKLTEWNPEVRYDIDEIIEAFNLDLDLDALESVDGGASTASSIDRELLTLDTVIETSEGFMTFGEYRASDYGKLRCQATWCRPDSVTWNGYLDRHKNGEPHFVDNGTQIKYVLGAMELFKKAEKLPVINAPMFEMAVEKSEVVRSSNEALTLDEMVDRFIFVSVGSFVIDGHKPEIKMSLTDFHNTYMYCFDLDPQSIKPKPRYFTKMWMTDHRRIIVNGTDFMPNMPNIFDDPTRGRLFNEYKEKPLRGFNETAFSRFVDHVRWLIPDDAEYEFFMNWIAHLIQKPQDRPHTFIVMTTPEYGTGRSLVYSILRNIVGYYNTFDLNKDLTSSFNDTFSKTLLLTGEEVFQSIRERGDISSRLRDMASQQVMTVNAKFEKKRKERIFARMLLASNHVNPIDIDEGDRRAVIITNPTEPRYGKGTEESVAYYADLYDMEEDESCLASIRDGLMSIDISGFRPNAPAPMTFGKRMLLSSNMSVDDHEVIHFIKEWPTDIVTKEDLIEMVLVNRGGVSDRNSARKAVIGALNRYGATKSESRYRIAKVNGAGETKSELWILRNHRKWMDSRPKQLVAEVLRGRK